MNNPTMNICVQVLCEHVFNSLGRIPKGGISVAYGISMFNFLRNCQIVFNSCTIFVPTSNVCDSNFSTSSPTLVIFSLFFLNGHPCGVKWYFTVVLTYISLMMNDVVHILRCCVYWPFVYLQ